MRGRIAIVGWLLAIAATAIADPAPPVAIDNGKPGAFTISARVAVKLQTVASIEALRDGK